MVKRVEEKKQEMASLQGQRKQILQQLSSLGAKTLDQAKKLLKEAEEEIKESEDALNELLSKLETDYDWD